MGEIVENKLDEWKQIKPGGGGGASLCTRGVENGLERADSVMKSISAGPK